MILIYYLEGKIILTVGMFQTQVENMTRLARRASKRKKNPHLRFQLFWAQKYLYFPEQLKLKSKPGRI